MRKRILSMLLALAMVASLLPMTVLAAGDPGTMEQSNSTFRGASLGKVVKYDSISWLEVPPYTEGPDARTIVLSPKTAAAGTYENTHFELAPNTGYVARIVPQDESDEIFKHYDNAYDASRAIYEYESYIDGEIETGDYLIIDVYQKDASVKYSYESAVHNFYGGYFKVEASSEIGLAGDGHKIKGFDFTPEPLDDASSVNLGHEHFKPGNISYVEMGYDDAVSSKATVFKTKDANAKVVVKAIPSAAFNNTTNQNVKYAFEQSQNVIEEATALPVGENGGYLWLVAKVTSEDGQNEKYYAAFVKVNGKKVAKISDVKAANLTTGAGKKTVKFEGDLNGGTVDNPSRLTVKVPKPADLLDVKEEKGEFNIHNIVVEFTTQAGVEVRYVFAQAGASVANDEYRNNPGTPDSNNMYQISGDFNDNDALYLKVTNTGATESVKYYELIVTQEKGSDDTGIKSGSVYSDFESEKKTVIKGELDTVGTCKTPAQLTAEVAYDTRLMNAYSRSTIEVVVPKGARVYYLTYGGQAQLESERAFDRGYYASLAPSQRGVAEGMSKRVISSANLRATPWIYMLVIAEDRDSTSVYELHVTMAEVGTEAALVDVVPTSKGQEVTGYVVNGLDAEESSDPDEPTVVQVTVPYGSYTDIFSAEFKASYGADVKFYGTNKTYENSRKVGALNFETAYYVEVVSGNQSVHSFYKVMFKVADLKLNASSPDAKRAELDLQNGLLVVSDGTIDANAVGALIDGVDTAKIANAAGENVTGTAKVGTGYTVTVGNTTITVVLMGDTNGDAEIDIADAVKVRNHILEAELTNLQTEAADMNGDGVVDIADAVAIRNALL